MTRRLGTTRRANHHRQSIHAIFHFCGMRCCIIGGLFNCRDMSHRHINKPVSGVPTHEVSSITIKSSLSSRLAHDNRMMPHGYALSFALKRASVAPGRANRPNVRLFVHDQYMASLFMSSTDWWQETGKMGWPWRILKCRLRFACCRTLRLPHSALKVMDRMPDYDDDKPQYSSTVQAARSITSHTLERRSPEFPNTKNSLLSGWHAYYHRASLAFKISLAFSWQCPVLAPRR